MRAGPLVITLRSLGLGALCGIIAYWAGLPLPWMLGPMIGTTIAAASGLGLHQPALLPKIAFPVIGVMLGSRITAQLVNQASEFAITLVLLIPFTILCAGISYIFYRRVGSFDRVTAFYAGMPGGLNDMMILGGAAGGDERRIGLAHAARVLCVIGFVAVFFGWVLGVRSSTAASDWLTLGDLGWTNAAWLFGAALAGIPLGKVLRLPAPQMLGPMIVSGAIHIAGLVTVPPPDLLVIAAQVVLGVRIGSRFAGVTFAFIARDLVLGAMSSVLMISVAVLFAFTVAALTGVDPSQAFLAFSPGGFIEMSLLALALGQEVAYVSLAHVMRIVLVIFGAPMAFRALGIRG